MERRHWRKKGAADVKGISEQYRYIIFVVGNIPLMYLLNKDWYHVLMHTLLGQVILSATAAAIFISAGFVVKLTRPIEYRR